MKERLGVDIDETIVWHLRYFLDWHNAEYDTKLTEEDFHSYKWWEILGCDKAEAYARAETYSKFKIEADRHMAHFGLHFVEGSQQGLDLLSRYFELYGITSRDCEIWAEDTHNISSAIYVENGEGSFFPDIPFDNEDGLIFPSDRIYSSTDLKISKAELCKSLGIKIHIDDDADVAYACAEVGIEVHLLDRPWNRNLARHKLIHRAFGWQDICDRLSQRKVKLPDINIAFYL